MPLSSFTIAWKRRQPSQNNKAGALHFFAIVAYKLVVYFFAGESQVVDKKVVYCSHKKPLIMTLS